MTDMEMGLIDHMGNSRPIQPAYGEVFMAVIPAILILGAAAALMIAVL